MAARKHAISLLMALIVIVLDLYWTYLAYSSSYHSLTTPVYLGIIIFIASIIWIWADM